jgi:hypothetical protein
MYHGDALPRSTCVPAANRLTAFGRLLEKQIDQLSDLELADMGRGGGLLDTSLAVGVAGPGAAAVDVTQPAAQQSTVISAGFTFLGQFIDHDMTFMEVLPALGQRHDLTEIKNRRVPFLNLDSVYGDGPDDPGSRHLYDGTGRFRIGTGGIDLPRDGGGVAQIADPRNDENLVISQLHLVLLRLHNALTDKLVGAGVPVSAEQFALVRRRVMRRWQYICLARYLPTLVAPAVIDDLLINGAERFEAMVRGLGEIAVPVEFAVAAFRFGHSQVREGYLVNQGPPPRGLPLFNPLAPRDMSGRKPVTGVDTIDFALFFTEPSFGKAFPAPFNASMRIDALLASSVFRLPRSAIDAPPVSLAERNLRRGAALELPSGQAAALAFGVPALTAAQLQTPDPVSAPPAFAQNQRRLSDAALRNTPLWFYILKEAEVVGAGNKLGPVGERIVGETFVGLLRHDPTSLINLPVHLGQGLAGITPADPDDAADTGPDGGALTAGYDVLDLVKESLGGATRAA